MTSLKPYLIRAIYEWIVDNKFTPHLLVDADNDDTVLPMSFVEDGKIVLNIRPEAVQDLSLGNETIHFNARFGGKPLHVIAPLHTVMAIYAKENGKGMVFDQDDEQPPPTPPDKGQQTKPNLRVVK
jgi:stringent starvation protein B